VSLHPESGGKAPPGLVYTNGDLPQLTTTTMIIAPQPKEANAAPASASIDATQMMKDARNLPVERFDAH